LKFNGSSGDVINETIKKATGARSASMKVKVREDHSIVRVHLVRVR